MNLSEAQRTTLKFVADQAMVLIVHQGESFEDAWDSAFERQCAHQATRRALVAKGIAQEIDGRVSLGAHGQNVAKKVWSERNDGDVWDQILARITHRREEKKAQEAQERAEWQQFAESLPEIEGYQLRTYPFRLNWEADREKYGFAYIPSISIEDRHAPESGVRYQPAQWYVSISSVGSMDKEAVRLLGEAIQKVQMVMATLEARHANDPVKEII